MADTADCSALGTLKRPATPDSAALDCEPQEKKRLRTAVETIADEWVCPITLELPLEPVLAADGRTYEKEAILKQFRNTVARSPVTRECIDPTLKPNVQAKNTIEALVRSGVLNGNPKAERWVKKVENADTVFELTKRAEHGDVAAILELVFVFRLGMYDVPKDEGMVLKWSDRGSYTTEGTIEQAKCLYEKAYVCNDKEERLHLLTLAAAAGLDIAMLRVAEFFYNRIQFRAGATTDKGKEIERISNSRLAKDAMKWLLKISDARFRWMTHEQGTKVPAMIEAINGLP